MALDAGDYPAERFDALLACPRNKSFHDACLLLFICFTAWLKYIGGIDDNRLARWKF